MLKKIWKFWKSYWTTIVFGVCWIALLTALIKDIGKTKVLTMGWDDVIGGTFLFLVAPYLIGMIMGLEIKNRQVKRNEKKAD